mgnify:CR=1 FL=1
MHSRFTACFTASFGPAALRLRQLQLRSGVTHRCSNDVSRNVAAKAVLTKNFGVRQLALNCINHNREPSLK